MNNVSSADLNPLHFWFWSYVTTEIFHQRPETLDALKAVVEDFFNVISSKTIRLGTVALTLSCYVVRNAWLNKAILEILK